MDKKNAIFPQISMQLLKGRYIPFETAKGIVNIKHIYTFESHRKLYPHLLFQSDQQTFLGIICARHTSDLLNLLLKKLVIKINETEKQESSLSKTHFIIQYALPNDKTCYKLILLTEIESATQFESIQQELRQLFDKFQECMQKLTEKILDNP